MKTKRMLLSVSCVLGLLAGLAGADKLGVGDPAPELAIKQWIQGDLVKIAGGKGKTTYVVEFWATWCPPCKFSIPQLTKLQETYKDHNVVIVGITDEKPKLVADYVKKMGDKMAYRVAVDDGQTTGDRYMKAAGQRGIPHAFVVDRDGRIAWQGHPLDSGLEAALAKLTGYRSQEEDEQEEEEGDDERQARKMKKLETALRRALVEEDWDEALDLLDEMLEIEEDNLELKTWMFRVLCQQGEDPEEIAELADELAEEHADDAEMLNLLAWEMVTCSNIACRNPVLAMQIAESAYEACKGEAGHIIDTLARAYYVAGELEEAIRLQKQACAKSEGTRYEGDLAETLEYYQQCLKAREHMKKH